MTYLKVSALGLSLALLCSNLSAQQVNVSDSLNFISPNSDSGIMLKESLLSLQSTSINNITLSANNNDKNELSNLPFQNRIRLISDEYIHYSLNEYKLGNLPDDENKKILL
jgi:hypothetical protein